MCDSGLTFGAVILSVTPIGTPDRKWRNGPDQIGKRYQTAFVRCPSRGSSSLFFKGYFILTRIIDYEYPDSILEKLIGRQFNFGVFELRKLISEVEPNACPGIHRNGSADACFARFAEQELIGCKMEMTNTCYMFLNSGRVNRDLIRE
jgi:hypothetical protein